MPPEIQVTVAVIASLDGTSATPISGEVTPQAGGFRVELTYSTEDAPPDPPDPPDPSNGMVATVTAKATPYHAAGTYTYAEYDGEVLDTYHDPRGLFTVDVIRCTQPDFPLELYFHRIDAGSNGQHAYVECYWGDPSVCDASKGYGGYVKDNIDLGAYTVTVAGDFVLTGATDKHWRFARWRLCSWGTPEHWPLPLTPVETLLADALICGYDEEAQATDPVANAGASGSPYAPYQPMRWAGLRSDWGTTGEDNTIGLLPDQAALYFAKEDPQALAVLANLTEAFSSFPLYYRDPATGAIMNAVGPADHRQYYGWWDNGSSSHRPTLANASVIWNCTFDGPTGTVLPGGMRIVDMNGVAWPLNNGPHTLDDSGLWDTAQVNAVGIIPSPRFPENDSTSTTFQDNQGKPLDLPGVTFTFLTADGYEGADNFRPTMNHACNAPYAYAVLTRDPYHIKSVQAIASYWDAGTGLPTDGEAWGKQNNDGTNWAGYNETRAQAWKVRDLAQAVLATPADAPSWLLPAAEFRFCLDQHRIAYMYRYDNPWCPEFQAWNTIHNSIAGDNYLRNSGGIAFYQEDYLLLAMARALVVDAAWMDVAHKLLEPRIAMVNGGDWCKAIVTMYGNPGYWAQGPITNGRATGPHFTSWEEAWNDPDTGWLKTLSTQYPTPPLDPCPGHIVFPGNDAFESYNCNFYAAVGALRQLGMCGGIEGFDDMACYVRDEMRAKFASGTTPVWKQCASHP